MMGANPVTQVIPWGWETLEDVERWAESQEKNNLKKNSQGGEDNFKFKV